MRFSEKFANYMMGAKLEISLQTQGNIYLRIFLARLFPDYLIFINFVVQLSVSFADSKMERHTVQI